MVKVNYITIIPLGLFLLFSCDPFAPNYSHLARYLARIEPELVKPDLTRAKRLYQKGLAGFVLQADSTAHDTILQAFSRTDPRPALRARVILAALYNSLYNGFNQTLDRISAMRLPGWYEYEAEKLKYIYQALSPLVINMGKWFGRGPEMDETCWLDIRNLLPFPYTARADQAATRLREMVLYSYILYVIYQLEEMEAVCGSDPRACQEHQLTAQRIFDGISGMAANDTLRANIAATLKKPFAEIDGLRLRKALRQGFPHSLERVPISFKR